MIYIGNIEILTAKSAIYLGNVGSDVSCCAFSEQAARLKAAAAIEARMILRIYVPFDVQAAG